ncbi:MAG: P1 family peptidase [Gemmatimonadetes bacterium]|nr:P1 family peptidase [Gemmatimonadota bacterium]
MVRAIALLSCVASLAPGLSGQQASPVRARDLGIPFSGITGRYNAITDVPGVEVGYSTLIQGTGPWKRGEGPIRTGVTVVLPKGKTDALYNAGYFIFNGDGEMTGLPYLHDYGRSGGPIGITNTNSVGVVRDAIGMWLHERFGDGSPSDFSFGLPVVGETWDGFLNEINGVHVKPAHVFAALNGAAGGRIAEGSVGGGTGMTAYYLKAGTGTASRSITIGTASYTVGVLVQANLGRLEDLVIAGVPVGPELADLEPIEHPTEDGSIIIVVGTDAPLSGAQLNLVAKRAVLGMGRTGTRGESGSGDLIVAFSTVGTTYDSTTRTMMSRTLSKQSLNPVFRATVDATEEAILNSIIAATDMDGLHGRVFALPHERLRAVLRKYNRLNP